MACLQEERDRLRGRIATADQGGTASSAKLQERDAHISSLQVNVCQGTMSLSSSCCDLCWCEIGVQPCGQPAGLTFGVATPTLPAPGLVLPYCNPVGGKMAYSASSWLLMTLVYSNNEWMPLSAIAQLLPERDA